MKRLIAFFILLVFHAGAFAQAPDRFSSYEDMIGKEVVFYGTKTCYEQCGPYAYYRFGDKYKIIRNASEYESFDSVPLQVTNIINWKKKSFLEIHTALNAYYLLLDGKIDYSSLARSITYWRNMYEQNRSDYQYVRQSSPFLSNKSYGKPEVEDYLPISWNSIQLPLSLGSEVKYDCSINTNKFSITQSDVDAYKSYFASKEEYFATAERLKAEKREKERRDSIADRTIVCEAIILKTTDAYYALKKASDIIDYNELEDTLVLSVYRYEDKKFSNIPKKYHGIVLGYDVELYPESLVFKDPQAQSFINSRGDEGMFIRRTVAKKHDEAQMESFTEKQLQRAAEIKAKLEAADKFYRQKKIFLKGRDYSYSSYEFGIEFIVFNCFDKDIKYIDFRVVAYNAVGDRQGDRFGNSSKEVRCIGPLGKGESGTWNFNELFWNEHGIIDKLEITEAKFTFKDNSTMKYSGTNSINQHYVGTYAKEVLKILGIEDN